MARRRKAEMRLFTLPYLGAGASIFSTWRISPEIEICPIQLPGREERSHEAPITVGLELIAKMAEGIAPLLDKPFAIYGHSFGGNIAMSLASYLEGTTDKQPKHLFIGAAVPPGVENPLESEFRIFDAEDALSLSKEKMKALLGRIGTPDRLLNDEQRFLALLPALRADLAITRQRLFPKNHVLKTPITAVAANDDHIYKPDIISNWERFTIAFNMKIITGGHLFIHEQDGKRQLLQIIGSTLLNRPIPQIDDSQKSA